MKKQPKDQPEKDAIEARVDAMMDINADGITDQKQPPASQPIDIFAGTASPVDDTPGAPPVPGARHTKARSSKPEALKQPASQPTLLPAETEEPPATVADPAPLPAAPELPLADDVKVDNIELDTPQTDEAISDIVAQEADEVLAAQDAGLERAIETADDTTPPPTKAGHPFFWFFIALLAAIAAAAAYVLTRPGLTLPFAI